VEHLWQVPPRKSPEDDLVVKGHDRPDVPGKQAALRKEAAHAAQIHESQIGPGLLDHSALHEKLDLGFRELAAGFANGNVNDLRDFLFPPVHQARDVLGGR